MIYLKHCTIETAQWATLRNKKAPLVCDLKNSTKSRAFRKITQQFLTRKSRCIYTRILRDVETEHASISSPGQSDDSDSSRPPLSPLNHSSGQQGSLFGAIALITGSTVGAGMLALPEVTAPAGFVPTATGLIATWALLTAEAMLMAEVNIKLLEQQQQKQTLLGDAGNIVTLRQMAERTLGERAGFIVTTIYLLLSYCLLVAYLAKSSELLDTFVGNSLDPTAAALVLCASTSLLFLLGGTIAADRLNQFLTSVLLILFVCILGVGVFQNDVITTVTAGPAVWSSLPPAIPIIFLSLVFHDLIPVICSFLHGDRKLVRSALALGSFVPLAMFLSWEAVALSLIPDSVVVAATSGGGGSDDGLVALQEVSLQYEHQMIGSIPAIGSPFVIDPLQVFIKKSGPGVALAVQSFSFIAVVTSFTGTVMGLSETLRTEIPVYWSAIHSFHLFKNSTTRTGNVEPSGKEGLVGQQQQQQQQQQPHDNGRKMALALSLLPPLAFTAENPDAFLAVLSIAGGYGMTALYGVMPPLMAWKLRQEEDIEYGYKDSMTRTGAQAPKQPQFKNKQMRLLPGDLPALVGVLAAAVLVGMSRVAVDAHASLSSTTQFKGDGVGVVLEARYDAFTGKFDASGMKQATAKATLSL